MQRYHLFKRLSVMLVSFVCLLTHNTMAQATLVINEAMTENVSTIRNPANQFIDWFEIINIGDAPINLSEWETSDRAEDDLVNLGQELCIAPASALPNIVLDPGEIGLVFTSSLAFNLSEDEKLYLCLDGVVQDSLEFPNSFNDISFSRFPDGTGPFAMNVPPTPGFSNEEIPAYDAANRVTGPQVQSAWANFLALSEYSSSNNSGININGTTFFDDWVEICSVAPFPVAIGDFSLAKNTSVHLLTPWRFPVNASVPANSCIIVLMGDNPASPALPANTFRSDFKLNKDEAETLVFRDENNRLINSYRYKVKGSDISVGLHPDTDRIVAFNNPTPGAPNAVEAAQPVQLLANEILASTSENSARDEFERTNEWVEIVNTSDFLVELEGFKVADEDITNNPFIFPPMALGPKQYLVLWFAGTGNSYVDRSVRIPTSISQTRSEAIRFFNPQGTLVTTVFAVAGTEPGTSIARFPDASPTGNFVASDTPTPGLKNTNASSINLIITEAMVNPLPNPNPLIGENGQACQQRGLKDEDGECHDWLEVFNAGTTAVDLEGFVLTDAGPDFAPSLTFPAGESIAPNSFKIVFFSGKNRSVAGQPLHANSNLAGEEFVRLYDDEGREIDHFLTVEGPPNGSAGYPSNRPNEVLIFQNPTPGAANEAVQPLSLPALVINEIFTKGTGVDYVEFINMSGSPLDVAGWGFSDERDEPFKFIIPNIPEETILEPGEFFILIADDAVDSPFAADFKLGDNEEVWIGDSHGQQSDFHPYGVMISNIPIGRWPDGVGPFVPLVGQSPLAPNQTDVELFIRGDANNDVSIDISDPVKILFQLFAGSPFLNFTDASDTNDDGTFNIADPIFLLTHLFRQGAPPPQPYPDFGEDPTPDGL